MEPTAAVPSSAISEQGVGIRPTQTSMTQFPRQLCPYLLQSSRCFQPGRLKQGSKGKGGLFYPSLGDKWSSVVAEDTDLWLPVLPVVPGRSFRGISWFSSGRKVCCHFRGDICHFPHFPGKGSQSNKAEPSRNWGGGGKDSRCSNPGSLRLKPVRVSCR